MSRHSMRDRTYLRARRAWLLSGSHGWLCWLCHEPVDPTTPRGTPMAPTIDHVVPMGRGGNGMDRAGWRLAHLSCNSRRQDDPPPLGRTSRDW